MGSWVRAIVILAILGGTLWLLGVIADRKSKDAAGGLARSLAEADPAAREGFTALVARLREAGYAPLADQLEDMARDRSLWVATRLDPARRAVYVEALFVRRVYIGDRVLTRTPADLYPELDVPEGHREAYAWITLAGTLVHELAHARGVTSEAAAYELEAEWYRALGQSAYLRGLSPEATRAHTWAIDHALRTTAKARSLAVD